MPTPIRSSLWAALLLGLALSAAPERADAQVPPVFIKKWGSYGANPSQFLQITNMATGPDGSVYVGDASTPPRIEHFTADGVFVNQWVPYDYPTGITTDAAGNVYVLCTSGVMARHSIVQIYDKNGNLLAQWGGTGANAMQAGGGIALDAAGNVYISDSAFGVAGSYVPYTRIIVFSPQGVYLHEWGYYGVHLSDILPATFSAVAVDHNGDVLVGEYTRANLSDFVNKYSSTGALLGTFVSNGFSSAQVLRVTALTVDPAGNIQLLDAYACRVKKFSTSGALLLEWGACGTMPGQFHQAAALATNPGDIIYVGDNSSDQPLLTGVLEYGDHVTPAARRTWGELKVIYR